MSDSALRNRPGCSPYSPEALDRFQAALLSRREEIARSGQGLADAALGKEGTGSPEKNALSEDPADHAADAWTQSLSLEMLGKFRVELEEIALALERIHERSYGVCSRCGKRIPEARLEAVPAADTCVPCKVALERG